MAMRDGAAYLAGLKDQRRIWHNGGLVDDVTSAPGFANAAHTIAGYYDFQCDPANRDISPTRMKTANAPTARLRSLARNRICEIEAPPTRPGPNTPADSLAVRPTT